ncbi:hypothetical protein H8356DRAFT_1342381 [Neocallimastix lanati (nom. inval.)]|nr:hypothetical protein H8356DRAFT_1342381 [Neocallimastix sp. JGI-2020a]
MMIMIDNDNCDTNRIIQKPHLIPKSSGIKLHLIDLVGKKTTYPTYRCIIMTNIFRNFLDSNCKTVIIAIIVEEPELIEESISISRSEREDSISEAKQLRETTKSYRIILRKKMKNKDDASEFASNIDKISKTNKEEMNSFKIINNDCNSKIRSREISNKYSIGSNKTLFEKLVNESILYNSSSESILSNNEYDDNKYLSQY